MIIIELYNETTIIQCETQEKAQEVLEMYANTEDPHYQNLQMREVEVVAEET